MIAILDLLAQPHRTMPLGVFVSRMLCVVRQKSLRRADHSSRGVVPSLVFLSVIWKCKLRRPGPTGGVAESWGQDYLNPLNAELNPVCHWLALLGAHHILHVSRIRVKVGGIPFFILLFYYSVL